VPESETQVFTTKLLFAVLRHNIFLSLDIFSPSIHAFSFMLFVFKWCTWSSVPR